MSLKAPNNSGMVEILINLPQELVKYMDEDPYVGDRSRFIAMLIRKWQRELERSKREIERDKNDPRIIREFS